MKLQYLLIPFHGSKWTKKKRNCSYLVVQHILALPHALGHLVVQVLLVSHLDLAGHMTLLHLSFLDKCEVCSH